MLPGKDIDRFLDVGRRQKESQGSGERSGPNQNDRRDVVRIPGARTHQASESRSVVLIPRQWPTTEVSPTPISQRDTRKEGKYILNPGDMNTEFMRTVGWTGASSDVGATNESIGVGDGLFEPVPLKEDYLTDDGSVHSKKRTFRDTSKAGGVASYTVSLEDPFSPRPIVQTENHGLSFVGETTMEKSNFSLSSIETNFEDEAYQTDATDTDDSPPRQPKKPRAARKLPSESIRQTRSEENDSIAAAPKHTRMPSSPSILDSSSSPGARGFMVPKEAEETPRQEGQVRDAESIMARLEQLMFKSEMTQAALQYYDKRRGLPRSHCQTMVNSSRSRKQLLEGKIIKKWNGRPLLGEEESLSISSEGGLRRRRERRKSKTDKNLTTEEKEQEGVENVHTENFPLSIDDEKPKRRMSAPPSCGSAGDS